MDNLTDKWRKGDIEALPELIKQIEETDNSRSLSDEYLKEKGLMTREEYGVAKEYPYGIVMVISDYVLPYLEKLQDLNDNIKLLKAALKYSNTTSKVALDFIKDDVRCSNQLKLIKVMEQMLIDTRKVLK